MKLYNINTTSWREEDFTILTDLTAQQIIDVITPFVEAERESAEGDLYDNELLVTALIEAYPENFIEITIIENICI